MVSNNGDLNEREKALKEGHTCGSCSFAALVAIPAIPPNDHVATPGKIMAAFLVSCMNRDSQKFTDAVTVNYSCSLWNQREKQKESKIITLPKGSKLADRIQ